MSPFNGSWFPVYFNVNILTSQLSFAHAPMTNIITVINIIDLYFSERFNKRSCGLVFTAENLKKNLTKK